jgi:type I restriction enzyme, S subunit
MHHGLVEQHEKFKKRVASLDTSSYKVVIKGQLVVGFPIDEGVLSIQKLHAEAIVSPAYEIWDLGDVHPAYLERYLRSPRALAYYASKLRSTTARRRSLPRDTFLDLPVPLPSWNDQDRIVTTLDRTDAIRAKRRESIEILDNLAWSIFLDMFGDPTTNSLKWPVKPLGEFITDGPQNGLYKPSSAYGEGTPIVRIDSFYSGVITKIDSLKRVTVESGERNSYSLSPGDILINRVNSPQHLGKSALVPPLIEPTIFESNMMRFRVDECKVLPRFIVQLLQSDHIKKQIATRAKHAINQSIKHQPG